MQETIPLRIVQYGLGPIGQLSASTVLDKQRAEFAELAGCIDIDPEKMGRDVAELIGAEAATGVIINGDADAVLRQSRPDVVLHTTSSFLDRVMDQLLICIRAGVHVVSSTEELLFPFERHPVLSRELDEAAREAGVVILGTGVNPGYAMDSLALMATGICRDVREVHVERVVDASRRRLPLQQKIGAGITPEAFAEKKRTGTLGHIGLRESLLLVAHGLGWPLEEIVETLDPVLAAREVETPYLTVQPGQVAGIHHRIWGTAGGKEVLTLDLKMYAGAESPRDAIRVTGDPPMNLVIPDGIFGDTATVAALINAAPLVHRLEPGLRTMTELPLLRAYGTGR